MSQVTNNHGSPPELSVPVRHSRSKAEKLQRAAEKKARRAANLAARAEREEAIGLITFALAVVNNTLQGTDNGPTDSGDTDGSDVCDGAGSDLLSSDAVPALNEDASGTDAVSINDNGVPAGAAAGNNSGDVKLSKKQTKAEKWKAKTAAAAAARAAKEAMPSAECSPDLPDEVPGKVVHSTADLVSSVNAEYDSSRSSSAPEDEGANPGEELVKHGSFKAMDAAEKGTDNGASDTNPAGTDLIPIGDSGGDSSADTIVAPVGPDMGDAGVCVDNDTIQLPPVEVEEENGSSANVHGNAAVANASDSTVEEENGSSANVHGNAAVANASDSTVSEQQVKPTLVVDNTTRTTTADHKAWSEGAARFYGKVFTAERSSLLTEAYRYLEMAIRHEAEGKTTVEMALKQALRYENEAFNAVAVAKAA